MRRVLVTLLLVIAPATVSGQTESDRDAVVKVVQLFFDTMTASMPSA
jgi:hypothetical protein